MAKDAKELSDKHLIFIEHLIQTQGNKTEAALLSGYSAKTAGQIGYNLANTPVVKAEYERRLTELRETAQISTESIINELAAIGFSNISDIVDWQGARMVKNPNYLTPDQKSERRIERETQEALGHTPPPLDDSINETDEYIEQLESVILKDSASLSRRTKGTVAEVSQTPGKFGYKLSIKMHNKLDALGKLTNMLGLNQPKKVEVNTTIQSTSFGIKRRAPLDKPPVSATDTPHENV
jgi:phage terminase small subunit